MSRNLTIWTPDQGDFVLTAAVLNEILGEQSGGLVNTSITTAGAGVLTAAGLVGGQIARTGPVAAYTDTTDTAAAIVTALGGFISGMTFIARIKNATAYQETLAGGTGVTMSASAKVPPFAIGTYFGTVGGTSASPTVTFTHMSTTAINSPPPSINPQSTALTTVGAGTITAAGIASGFTLRSGATSAFTDTTDTAANILAAISNLVVDGAASVWTYVNNTVAAATLAAGSGVTLSPATVVVPANSWVRYLVTRTSSSAVTMTQIESGFFPHSGTFTNNGTSTVTTTDANVTAGSNIIITLKTVGGTVGAIPHLLTVTPGTGFATVGTASDTSVYNYTILG